MIIKAKVDGETTKMMQKKLQGVPAKLDDLFVQILNKVTAENLPETIQMMRWVLLAERTLTPIELLCALGYSATEFLDDDQRERFIRRGSQGLIEVKQEKLDENRYTSDSDENNSSDREATRAIVQFIHESVRDFLVQGKGLERLDAPNGDMAIGKGHDLLAKACFNYLKFEEVCQITSPGDFLEEFTFDEFDCLSATYPFLYYAVNYMFKHAEKAEVEGIPQTQLVRDFHQSTNLISQ